MNQTEDRSDQLSQRLAVFQEIADKMDRVYNAAFHGIPVLDDDEAKEMARRVNALNVAVAAMRVKSDANQRVADLLKLSAAESTADEQADSSSAATIHLGQLNLTDRAVPDEELIRLAAHEILRLRAAVDRKLKVVG